MVAVDCHGGLSSSVSSGRLPTTNTCIMAGQPFVPPSKDSDNYKEVGLKHTFYSVGDYDGRFRIEVLVGLPIQPGL